MKLFPFWNKLRLPTSFYEHIISIFTVTALRPFTRPIWVARKPKFVSRNMSRAVRIFAADPEFILCSFPTLVRMLSYHVFSN